MNNINNIIFDLGGVVIDLNRLAAVEAYSKLGLSQASEMLGEYGQKWPFLPLEEGKFTSAEFFDTLRGLCQPGVSDKTLQQAFEAFLVGIPVERLRRLEELRRAGFRIFVLSNTNAVMYHGWIAREFRKDGKSINDYFDGIVASFEEGMCKPNAALFKVVTDRYNLDPASTLMLDDSEANCEGARSIGLNAIRIDNKGENSMLNVTAGLLEHAPCNNCRS